MLGPNGSGKSTVFDVFAFLAECFSDGLRKAWDRRGRFRELRSRDQDGSIVIELQYREKSSDPLIAYHLEIEETAKGPVVAREFLRWKRVHPAAPFHFLDYQYGKGNVITGEAPEASDSRIEKPLSGPDVLAVSTLGTLAENPRVIALRRFITDWHLSYLSADAARETRKPARRSGFPDWRQSTQRDLVLAGATSRTIGSDFPYAAASHPPDREDGSGILQDSRLLLLVKDAPFSTPVLSRFASDGTLKLLAYLTVLNDPDPPQLVGIEEPENYLHPRLLPELAEECQQAAERTQLIVTTHSPFFINPLRPEEVRVLCRAADGHTRGSRVADMPGIKAFLDQGATLGELWMEGHFDAGDPLALGDAE